MLDDEEEWHTCHFCGTYVDKQGFSNNGNERHFLSDCRPDLVEHETGENCTWWIKSPGIAEEYGLEPLPIEHTCYAYQDRDGNWTKEHKHFYKDGAM